MEQDDPDRRRYSFEEYKLYYESTEKVTDRRIALNTWNYGLCTAILIGIAGLSSWGASHSGFRLLVVLAIVFLAGLGFGLCRLWIEQIRDYKSLNGAKFSVLNAIAPLVKFEADDTIVSATPFAREWAILEKENAARKISAMNDITALQSSDAEFFVPNSLRRLFAAIVFTAVLAMLTNWASLQGALFDLKEPGDAPHAATVPEKP